MSLSSETIRAMTPTTTGAVLGNPPLEEQEQRDSILQAYSEKQLSRPTAAAMLGVTERHLNRLMKVKNLERAPSKKLQEKERVQLKRAIQQSTIKKVLRGTMTVEEASALLDISIRQTYRLLKKEGQQQDGSSIPRDRSSTGG